MAEQITQEITALPEAPKEGAGFRSRAAAFLSALVTFASQCAAWRTQVNAVADWINAALEHVDTQAARVDEAEASTASAADAAAAARTAAEDAAQLAAAHDAAATAAAGLATTAAASISIGTAPWQLVRAGDLGTNAWLDQTWLHASVTWDAPSCPNATQISTAVAIPGAEIGDKVFPSASIALSSLNLRGEVTATDVVTLYLSNLTGSSVDLAAATYYVAVLKRTPSR